MLSCASPSILLRAPRRNLTKSGLDLGLDPVRNLSKMCQGEGGGGLQMCRRAGLPGSDPVSSAPKHRQAPATPPLISDKICCFGAP